MANIGDYDYYLVTNRGDTCYCFDAQDMRRTRQDYYDRCRSEVHVFKRILTMKSFTEKEGDD